MPIFVNIKNCARCGGYHDNVKFVEFARAPRVDRYSHYAPCPKTGEPILMYLTEEHTETKE